MKPPALLLPERQKFSGLRTVSIECGIAEGYIATQPVIEVGTSYDEQIAT
jgi:hypothetical protein